MSDTNGSGPTHLVPLSTAHLRALRARLDRLEETITSLSEAVRGLQRPSALPHPPWNWRLLDDVQRRAAWRDLVDWVDWWMETYELESRLTPCWVRHAGVVQYLLALRWAHREVWAPLAEGPDDAPVVRAPSARSLVDWHLAAMPGVLEAVRQGLSGCNATTHGDGADPVRREQARRALRDAAIDGYPVGPNLRALT